MFDAGLFQRVKYMTITTSRRPGYEISRRRFLRAGAAGGAALLGGGLGLTSLLSARAWGANPGDGWIEKTIPHLSVQMASGALTSLALTRGYLQRIATLNPLLRAVLETNPQAEAIAAQRDGERRRGNVRGPLHGIPVLVKDNVATDDAMQTTAGSLALFGQPSTTGTT